MFRGCSSLTSLDLSSFDTSKVTNAGYMLENGKLNTIITPATIGSLALPLPAKFWNGEDDITSITSTDAGKTIYRHKECSGGTATCTKKAVCSICGNEYGELLAHDIITHEAKEPACTENGWQTYEGCSHCDYAIDKVEIPATGHTLTHHEANAATEEKEGNSEYWSCDECDKYFSDEAGTTEITNKSSVTLPKLTPEKTTAPAEENKSYWWLFLLLIPIAIGVGGVTLGIYEYKKQKENNN